MIKKDHVDIVLFIFQGILENIKVFTNKDKANKYYNELIKSAGYKNFDDYYNNDKSENEIFHFENVKIIK